MDCSQGRIGFCIHILDDRLLKDKLNFRYIFLLYYCFENAAPNILCAINDDRFQLIDYKRITENRCENTLSSARHIQASNDMHVYTILYILGTVDFIQSAVNLGHFSFFRK